MTEQAAVPGLQHQSASYLGEDPVGLVGQLERSNLAYADPQASCQAQAAAGTQNPAGAKTPSISSKLHAKNEHRTYSILKLLSLGQAMILGHPTNHD
jgi:hypothetical protein